MKVLILTSEIQKIEVVELEVGDRLFDVRIMELGFSDVFLYQKTSVNMKDLETSTKSESNSSSESSSEDPRRPEIAKGHKVQDAIIVKHMGNDSLEDREMNGSKEISKGQNSKKGEILNEESERENVELVSVGVEEGCSDSSEGDVNFCNGERVFFPEFEQKKDSKRRYGSLMLFQDKNLYFASVLSFSRIFNGEFSFCIEAFKLSSRGSVCAEGEFFGVFFSVLMLVSAVLSENDNEDLCDFVVRLFVLKYN
ncbi:hypothetical protein V6N13_009440 [Hibiscus sabdariffa]